MANPVEKGWSQVTIIALFHSLARLPWIGNSLRRQQMTQSAARNKNQMERLWEIDIVDFWESNLSPNQGHRYQILNWQNALTGKFSKIWATKTDIETYKKQMVFLNDNDPLTDGSKSNTFKIKLVVFSICMFTFDILSASTISMVLMLLRWCEVFPLGNKGKVVQML